MGQMPVEDMRGALMTFPPKFGFYGILTNPTVGYERLASVMVAHSVRVIQLRIKDAPKSNILQIARSLRKITAETGSYFIINDSPEIAFDVQADGVHLGQGDVAYAKARALLGPDAIIGLSTHSVDQARAACALKPDYIAIGPVFSTFTKQNSDPVLGLSGLKKILEVATVPTVAIGGIDHSNVNRVLELGIRNVAAIGCISQTNDPAHSLKQMIETIEEHNGARI
jgi:thiamine-phosphate pyrophosphorylase